MVGIRSGTLLGLVLLGGCTPELEDLFGIDVYFVKLEEEPAKVAATAQVLAQDFGVDIIHTYDSVSEGFSAKLPALLVEDIEALDEVEYVAADEKVGRLPDDEKDPDVVDIVELLGGDEVPFSIQRVGGAYGGSLAGIEVAVVDSGIDGDHPDLNVVASEDFVAQSGGTPAPNGDLNGHGTHCAGTIGAYADGEGVMGVAPGVALHGVRVLDENGSGYWTDIVAGLEYVLEHPEIRVVNMSLGGPAFPPGVEDPMEEAIQRLHDAGVVVVIAAGNETQDTANVVPAGYDIGLVVSAALARLMEGNLTVVSRPGVGSTFTLRLPAFSVQHDIHPPMLTATGLPVPRRKSQGTVQVAVREEVPRAHTVASLDRGGWVAELVDVDSDAIAQTAEVVLVVGPSPGDDPVSVVERARSASPNRPIVVLAPPGLDDAVRRQLEPLASAVLLLSPDAERGAWDEALHGAIMRSVMMGAMRRRLGPVTPSLPPTSLST